MTSGSGRCIQAPVDLVGRLRELRALEGLLERAAGGSGGLVAVTGPGGSGRTALADAERQALLGELRRASGLGGRARTTSPEAERARVNVTRTLRATIDKIALAAPGCAAHLRASVHTGRACRYQPAPGGPSRWHV